MSRGDARDESGRAKVAEVGGKVDGGGMCWSQFVAHSERGVVGAACTESATFGVAGCRARGAGRARRAAVDGKAGGRRCSLEDVRAAAEVTEVVRDVGAV